MAVGGAAAARGAVVQLQPWFFAVSVGFLGYAHYWTWIRGYGHRKVKWILVGTTLLAAYLWFERAQLWVRTFFG